MDGRKKALGMNKKSKLLKRTTTNNTTKTKKKRLDIIRGIISYLKSDPYFYSPLLSSSPTHQSSARGLETEEPLKKNEGNFREKVVDYLKSDTYLYAPLEDTKSSVHSAAKNIISPRKGREQQFKKVNNKVPSRETLSQTKQVGKDSTQTKQVPVESPGEKQGDHISRGASGDAVVVTPSTPELLEVKRTVIRRSYHTRLSTISGNSG